MTSRQGTGVAARDRKKEQFTAAFTSSNERIRIYTGVRWTACDIPAATSPWPRM